MHRACGINDTACIVKNLNIFANSILYSLNQEPRTDVLMEKTKEQKSCDTVPLTKILMTRGPKEPLLIKRCLQQNISYENLSAI
jgi:hypothetical protein